MSTERVTVVCARRRGWRGSERRALTADPPRASFVASIHAFCAPRATQPFLFQPTDANDAREQNGARRGAPRRHGGRDGRLSPPRVGVDGRCCRESASLGRPRGEARRDNVGGATRDEGREMSQPQTREGLGDGDAPARERATVEALEEALAASARARRGARARRSSDRPRRRAPRPRDSVRGRRPRGRRPRRARRRGPVRPSRASRWRDRARAAESAREDAERRAARLASENAALVSMLERYRGVDPNTVDDPDLMNSPAFATRCASPSPRANSRAVARAPARRRPPWTTGARTPRASPTDSPSPKRPPPRPRAPDSPPTSRRREAGRRGGATRRRRRRRRRERACRPSRAVVAWRRTTRVWNSHGDTGARGRRGERRPRASEDRACREDGVCHEIMSAWAMWMRTSRWRRRWRRRGECSRRRSDGWRRGRRRRRAAALETSASRRLASKPAAVAVVDVRAAVESIERAVAEAV